MKLRAVAALVPLSLALVLVGAAPPAAAQATGWIRWGNWSPSAPDFDIYLNPFGGSGMTVIRHVRYGHVSVYRAIPAGQYTVAMRDSGAPATAPPTLSASVQVTPGMAFTIVSMGPASHLSYTGFLAVSPGWQAIHATGYSATASTRLFLRANTIHTLVVLDHQGGLRIHSLQDAVGSRAMPIGGAATGLGGTAPKPGTSPAPWLAIMAGGGLLAALGVIRLRRNRHRAAHAAIGR